MIDLRCRSAVPICGADLRCRSAVPMFGSKRKEMTGQHASDVPRRFHELDAIRGLAALMVVFSHFVLIWQIPWRDEPGFLSFLRYPFITGHEAVMLFFLLSGFVLSLPYLGANGNRT